MKNAQQGNCAFLYDLSIKRRVVENCMDLSILKFANCFCNNYISDSGNSILDSSHHRDRKRLAQQEQLDPLL